MTEIICISCWSSFEFDESDLSGSRDVTCPNCGFVQPGPARIPGPELDPTVHPGAAPPSPELDLTIQDGRPPAELIASLAPAEAPRAAARKKAERVMIAETQVGPPPAPPAPPAPPTTVPSLPVAEPALEEQTVQIAAFDLPSEEEVGPPPTIDPAEDPFRELQKVLTAETAATAAAESPLAGEVSAVSTVLNDIYGEPAISIPGVEDLDLEVPEKDERWRLRTASSLVLMFPDYETLARYLTGDEDERWGVAVGPGPFRPLLSFLLAAQTLEDPVRALVDVPPEDEDALTEALSAAAAEQAAAETAAAEEAAAPPVTAAMTTHAPKLSPGTITGLRRPDAGASPSPSPMPRRTGTHAPGTVTARPGRRGKKRRPNVTGEFTLKAAKPRSPWPVRLMFLVVGIAAGGGAVYYLAWLGMLPGILY